MLQGLIFLGLTMVVLGPIHWYLWRRMVRDTTRPGRGRKLVTTAFLVLPVSMVAAFIVPRVVGAESGFFISLVGYMWLAIMFYLFLILLVLEIPRRFLLPGKIAHASGSPGSAHPTAAEPGAAGRDASNASEFTFAPTTFPNSAGDGLPLPGQEAEGELATAGPQTVAVDPPGLERRLFLTRSAAIFAGLTATGIVGYGVKTALGDPVLKHVQIPLAKLPRGMDGYRIALVSDIHLGPLTGISHTERIVRSINGMDADIVAIVGDLVDGSVEELSDEAEPLRLIKSRDGAFFVTGNHEYYSGAQEWVNHVRSLGIRPLQNERLEIGGLDLAGVNDVQGEQFPEAGGGPDFVKTLGDRDAAKPVVLLAHQPVQASEAAKYKVDLQLSGHTHGGQMVPFNYIARLQQPVISGVGDVDGTKVYVTNGAGFWGPPVRVGAPPDITLVELRAG
nr:metallophosphoesterase [Catelliglobosispora koreensis]